MTTVRTSDLTPGQRVIVRGSGGLVRTVAEVGPTGFLNSTGETIYCVAWAEGRTAEWGPANSCLLSDGWELAPSPSSALHELAHVLA